MNTPSKYIWHILEELQVLGGSGTAREVIERRINQMNIPEKDKNYARRAILSAVNILKSMGYIDFTRNDVWFLTQKGQTRDLGAIEIIDYLYSNNISNKINLKKKFIGYVSFSVRKFPVELRERLTKVGSNLNMSSQMAAPLAVLKGIYILENYEKDESLARLRFDSYVKGQEGNKSIIFSVRKFPGELRERLKKVGRDLNMTMQEIFPYVISLGIVILENPKKTGSLSIPNPDKHKFPELVFDYRKDFMELIKDIKILKNDKDHKERGHESLVEVFYQKLGYKKHEEIKYRSGHIDILIRSGGVPLIVNEVKKNWGLTRNDYKTLGQAYNYANQSEIRYVVITNGDYYALFDLKRGQGYSLNFVFEFHVSKLKEKDFQYIRSMEKGILKEKGMPNISFF